jgi:hypothetical protein
MNNREAARSTIEELFRLATHTAKGQMSIQRIHVNKVIATNAGRSQIGGNRADKVWAWLAQGLRDGQHRLKSRETWTQQWISEGEQTILIARGKMAWGGDPAHAADVQRLEMVGAIRAWLTENEEHQGHQGPLKLRAQKLSQLKAAKKKMASKRGGRMAIYAAVVLMMADNEVVLTYWPNKPHNKGPWKNWIQESVEWMRTESRWISDQEATTTLEKATANHTQQLEEDTHLVVDMGEGWRGVGNAITRGFPDTRVVGVDRRGHTYTGSKQGVIISAVNHDFTVAGKDLLTALEKKVGRAIRGWLMLWLSPECSPMSIGNAMNQQKGAAHGEWAQTTQNEQNSSAERIAQEAEYLREALEALSNILKSLEAHPELKFALENPDTSRMWGLDMVREAVARNSAWRVVRVHQCAYGRRSQKPTKILTNIKGWAPAGITGTGMCVNGLCAGTLGNLEGNRRHQEQTIPSDKSRRPDQGEKVAGKREWTREAVVNAVAPELVCEIIGAARREKGIQEHEQAA